MDIDSGNASALIANGSLYLCTAPASGLAEDCDNDFNRMWFQDADNTQATNTTEAYVLTKKFIADSPGTYTFYINGETHTASASFYIYQGQTTKATAMFFHKHYLSLRHSPVTKATVSEQNTQLS